ncbi:hypothetical protein ACTFIU_002109 [Dictyostelium citrinum]
MPQDFSDHMTTSPQPLLGLNDFISIPSSSGPTPIFPSSIGSGHSIFSLRFYYHYFKVIPHLDQIIETHDDIDSLSHLISFCAGKEPLCSLTIQNLIMNNFQLWAQTNSFPQIALFETIQPITNFGEI